MITLLAVESAIPTSIFKAVLGILLLLAWAKWAVIVDKDAAYFHLDRQMWNSGNITAGAVGFLAMLYLPMFLLGFPVALLLIGGAAVGYVVVRNRAVGEDERWRFDIETLRESMARRREETAVRSASMRIKAGPGAAADLKPVPMSDDPRYEPHMQLEELLEPALRRRAQRLDLAGSESQFQTQMLIDGSEYRGEKLPPAPALVMIDYLKAQCGMDVEDRRRKQTGHCKVEMAEHGEHELKVRTAGSTRGLTCTILIDPIEQVTIPYEKLGLLSRQQEQLDTLIEGSSGVVVVATPPGQGRTTTLYAIMRRHDPYTMDLHAMEPAIEADMEGITQHEVDPDSLTRKFESLLLRDPQVVMLAQIAEAETAQAAAKAAIEGKRIYAGLNGEDGLTALKKWAKAVNDPRLAADGLAAAVSQRLVRRLCEYCRQKYRPDPAVLRKLNLPADRIEHLYKNTGQIMVKDKPEPCPACHGLGYRGRVAAFEVLILDDEARQLVRDGKFSELRTHLRRQKTMFLQEAVLSKVVSGETSISEASHVLGQSKSKSRSKSKPPKQKAG